MNDNSTHTEQLIQFMDGELQAGKLPEVVKTIEENPSVRQELENLILAKKAIQIYGLKARISSIHGEMMQEMKTPDTGLIRTIYRYGLRIAAVILILFGLSALYQYISVTPEKLFSENFHAFVMRQTRGSANTSLEDLYEKGDMNGLIQQFGRLKSPEATDCFLAGNAFLSIHRPAEAIATFIRMQQINKTNNTHYFDEDVEYFLALSYLANNEPSKALPLFEKIHTDPDHPFNSAVSGWFVSKVRRTVSAHE
jgi:hypothetical protein